ncbi:MAG: V-type ATPase subunit [Clostridia bacterium]|nr:V-type ATPase subunit [Clostridia bacterium]MDE7329082.1 V-type ATPase subunit [Clostridia bacterium]
MANNSLVYSNARVKAMENSFLTNEKIVRMAHSDSLEEGVKILLESSYGGGVVIEGNDYETLLQAEDRRVSEFMLDAMPKGVGMESFLIKNDYHNLKALTKGKYMRLDSVEFMLMPKGMRAIEELKEKVLSDDYSGLSEFMSEALNEIDTARANGNASPRFIDQTLDKACYKEIMSSLKKVKNTSIKSYWQTNIDLSNISSYIRCQKIGANDIFKDGFLEGGLLERSFFDGDISDKIAYSPYSKFAESIKQGDAVAFEREWDNALIGIFKEKRNDIFTIAPIAGFYVAKKIEIKIVRMICILLKNDVDTQIIKARLRELYA